MKRGDSLMGARQGSPLKISSRNKSVITGAALEQVVSRRRCLAWLGGGMGALATMHLNLARGAALGTKPSGSKGPFFQTRGVVLVPDDLTWKDWPERAKQAGLTTIGLHHGAALGVVSDFIRSDTSQQFLESCRKLGLHVEYELHAMKDLLPRDLFRRNPEFFRMNEKGERTADSNLCVHSEQALEVVAEKAVEVAKVLRPTTHRYFYWGDDARPWCHCPQCKGLSDSDQALIMEERVLSALRKFDHNAQLAHLAYASTLKPPTQVKPKDGIFLEYAPIRRRYDIPYAKQTGPEYADNLDLLDANLAVFGARDAQVLEYWLDVSRFSKWKKPAVKLPWDPEVFSADLETYGSRGIRHATTFAVYIDREYIAKYGEPPLEDYGKRLANWSPAQK
jgi:hypothetical protein